MTGAAFPRSTGLDRGNRAAEIVHALEDDVNDRWGDGEHAIARQVEGRLDFVRDFLDRRELQNPGQTLDGVESAKNRVDGIRIVWLPFQGEKALLDGGQMLTGFEDEIGD